MMENGKCVAAPGYEFLGKKGHNLKNSIGGYGSFCPSGLVYNNKRKCVDPSEPLWK
ncbi:hypothetical protein GO685_03740 [Wolbachia endosymbiont of Madathamugadia hiepei]|uniref:hypothetical protein n=1 Tax=Wolbachia endosymbiont of Madathamugadia hiepei TaxID=1241303 RepID=UPI001589C65A|nr:hypothetical protein [Wolbachia endosymbiont of Madathamugadia hiepei]NUX01589.1 hypothetical protein [Wolbachia endosymbiont of Madathamugadia hiepei]